MKKDICGLLIVLLLVIASRAGAHPGDGLVVVDDRTFYFVATDPLQGSSPTHHAALWRWSEEGGLALAYRSRHGSSNLHIEHGLDGFIYCAERHYLGERPAQTGDHSGDRDVFETQLGRLGSDGKITWLMGPTTSIADKPTRRG